jgi:hypothetical protein
MITLSAEIHLENGRFPKNPEETGHQKADQSIKNKLRILIG